MAERGNYPLLVYVKNTFLCKPVNNDDLEIEVTRNYYGDDIDLVKYGNYELPDPDKKSTHSINPGDTLGFPLYWFQERIVITLPLKSIQKYGPKKFCLLCGTKARSCLTYKKTEEEIILPPTLSFGGIENYVDLDGHIMRPFSQGAAWLFCKKDETGSLSKADDDCYHIYNINNYSELYLKIHKLWNDPEEENVTVGENPPG
jgi:hypothetical protein